MAVDVTAVFETTFKREMSFWSFCDNSVCLSYLSAFPYDVYQLGYLQVLSHF
jgi:hypothetical protein